MRQAALILAGALTIATPACAAAVGEAAPDFTARDAAGKAVTLAAYRGKTIVLEWTNNGCPFVRHMYDSGVMQRLQRDAAADGVVWLTIMSSAPGAQGYLTGPEAAAWKQQTDAAPADVILDPSGAVGHAYEAKTTPDMFVIGPTGRLVYAGAIDDTPSTDPADAKHARNYVAAALRAVRSGGAVDPAVTKSYGCSVKYQ